MKIKINFSLFFICICWISYSQNFNYQPLNNPPLPPGKYIGQNVFNGNEAIATSFTRSACGLNYVQASNPLYGRTGNNFTLGVAQPAVFTISGIPPCGIIERAFLYVSTTGTGAPVSANITNPLSGNSIFSMALIGTGADKNWGRTGSYTYRADVTPIASGNGNYVISGIPSSSLITDDDANGATLLIIYSDRTQNYTGNIVIADGSLTNANATGALTTTITGFDVCGTPSLSSTFLIVDDLQQYGNTVFALNNAVPNYSQLAVADQPWSFLTDPGSPVINGQTSASFGITNTMDTLGLILAGLYFQTDCLTCPITLTLAASSTPSCLSSATVDVLGGMAPYAYTWSGTAQTTSAVAGLSAGTETILVSDQLGCLTASTTVAIVTPAPPIALSSTSVCIGFSGSLTAGVAASYSWSPSGSLDNPVAQNVVASPLATTIYTLDYTDALGCSGSQTTQVLVTYTQNIGATSTTLCAAQNINLSSNAFAGTAYFWTGPNAYTYSSTSQPDPVIFNANPLMSGTYNLSVTSVPGCTSMAVTDVTVYPLPTPTVASNGTICAGFNLTLMSGGGTTYNWVGPNGFTSVSQNTSVVNSTTLASGVYSLTASFPTGCSRTTTLNALVRALPNASCAITSSNVCLGRTINFAATGGVSFSWNGPNNFTSNNQNPTIPAITLLANGVYTVTVTDVSGCQAQATTTLAALFNPTVAMICPQTCYGSVATLTANGLGFYTFRGPNGFLDTNPLIPLTGVSTTTVIANNLSAGVYTIELESALNSCTAQATGVLVTIPVPTIIATGSTVCYNAVATLTAAGGLANGSGYTWTGPAGYTSSAQYAFIPVTDNLTSGIYTVVGTAANACTTQATTTLITMPLPTVTATGTLICLNEPFTFTANGAVTYTWSGPSTYTANGSTAFVPLVDDGSIGDYTVVGTAANTCTQITTANLAYMPLPTITTVPDNVCLNEPAVLESDGGIQGGYRWAGPGNYTSTAQNATIASANSAAPTIYTVVGTAVNSCTNVSTALLTTIPLPTVTTTGTLICLNEPFTFTANGAVSYTWSGPSSYTAFGANAFVPNVDDLSIGNYVVVGTAPNTCTQLAMVNLAYMPLPTITAISDTVCYLTPATLKALGGITNGYRWTGPGGYISNLANAYIPVASSALPQTYTVVGTAPNSCTNITTATLSTFALPVPTYTAPSRVCFRSNIDLKAGGAATYTWSGPYYYLSPNQNVWFPTYNMQQAGIYTLSVTDQLGCKNDTTLFIGIDPLPEGNLISDNTNKYCAPYCATFKLNNISTVPILSTEWTIKNQTITGPSFNYCVPKAGMQTVLGSFTNAAGCVSSQSLDIIANPRPEGDFFIQPEKPVENVDIVYFNNLSKGEKMNKWNWYFIDNYGYISSEKNTSYIFQDASQYRVAMVVTNVWGCSDTVVKSIVVSSDVKIFVPDAFTPNGDGINDTFQPKGRGIDKYDLTVYDRWGGKIFRSDDFFEGWDGNLNGSACSDDVYAWRITYTDVNAQIKELTGHVTLIR